jgi:hypothetical protein
MANELVPLAAALKSMKRANSGMTWIRQKHVTAFLQDLAVAPIITHETFDELPDSRTREYVRGLLTEHGVLPRRDELRTRYENWSAQVLSRVSNPEDRDIIRRYIRWHHQRRMNQMDEITRGTFLRSKQQVTVAIDLLNWLTGHGTQLGRADPDLSRPLAGRRTHHQADRRAFPEMGHQGQGRSCRTGYHLASSWNECQTRQGGAG